MASQNIHLYDDVKQAWGKIALEFDIQDIITAMDDHEQKLINSEQGLHGLRYWNNKLEYSNDEGVTWTEIQTGGSVAPSEISDINGLQAILDSKVDDSDLVAIQQDIMDIQSELDTKADKNVINDIQQDVMDLQNDLSSTVKSVNGELPDANGNVEIQTSGTSISVEDSLTSTSVDNALSANQGKILKELIDTKTSLPISADDVTDTTSRVLISPQEQAQINTNTSDITNHSQRIYTLEQAVGNISSTDEKVKMNSTDVDGYLEDKLDGVTIQNVGNKLTVKGLDGLTVTVTELNLLTGTTSNIQAQINALASVGNFSTSLNTYTDLLAMSDMNSRDMVIVLEDETKDNNSTIYIYNGADWVYSGEFKGGEVRDFIAHPIDLVNETTGILPKNKYEKQNASETSVLDSDNNFTSTNVEGVLKELNSKIDASQQTVIINDTLTSISTTEALSANMGRKLDENLTSHESKIDVINEKGHVQIDDVTIKLNTDGKIYSVGGGTSTNNADDIVESSTRVFVSPTEKTDINHINREVIDKFTESTDGKLLFNGTEVCGITDEDIADIEDLINTHENKKVSDTEGVHGLRINRNKIMFKDENDVWIEFDTASSILPTAKSLIGTSSTDGTSITINWVNPSNDEYVKSELYVSKTDITNLDIEDLTSVASKVIDDNSTTTYTQATNYGEVYYFKVYTYHDILGEEKYSNPITISVRSEDKTPPSTVSNVKIEALDGSLKVTWTNPPESDLGNVRLNYSTSPINDINDGTMTFNGTGNTVTITGLVNGTTYNLRFFTIDNSGNINSDESMKYAGIPKIPSSGLKYYDTLTTIGATETIDGASYNEAGYFGTVPASELFTGSELASAVGITQGVLRNDDIEWLKFYIDGKILFTPRKSIRDSINWNNINASGSADGTRTVSKGDVSFKVRLWNTLVDDTVDNVIGSEWNRLMLPISASARDNSWTAQQFVDPGTPSWGDGFTNEDLGYLDVQGSIILTKNTSPKNDSTVIIRGGTYVEYKNTYSKSESRTNVIPYFGWLPVLEVVSP